MSNDENTSTAAELSSPDSGLHRIGPYTICCDGFTSHYERRRVSDGQIEIAKEFLSACRRTPWARDAISPISHDLKHWFEAAARSYISNGAVLIAALQLGIVIAPCERSAYVGVSFDSLAKLMATRGWHLTRHSFGKIKPDAGKSHGSGDFNTAQLLTILARVAKEDGFDLKPAPGPDYEGLIEIAMLAKEHGVDLGYDINSIDLTSSPTPGSSDPDDHPIQPSSTPAHWRELADELGIELPE